MNWDAFLNRLDKYPAGTHVVLPPCPEDRIHDTEKALGRIPADLRAMLIRFNGAELFIKTGPLVSLFGITTLPPMPPMQWATEWHLDVFTPKWQAAGQRDGEWPCAIMSYGVLLVLTPDGMVRDWDTGQRSWVGGEAGLAERIESLFHEGDTFLSEC